MITLEYRESADNWKEHKTYENEEELRQDINSFLYNLESLEEVYIYYSVNEKEKENRTKVRFLK